MVIPFAVLLVSIGYLCYQAKDDTYLIEDESHNEKDAMYKGLDDLFI